MSNLQYINLPTARLAKQLGYNNSCDALYHRVSDEEEYRINKMYCDGEFCQNRDLLPAPKQQELETWLRDEFGYYITVWPEFYTNGINWNVRAFWKFDEDQDDLLRGTFGYGDNAEFIEFEDALEFGLVVVMCTHILGRDINDSREGTKKLHDIINKFYPTYWNE